MNDIYFMIIICSLYFLGAQLVAAVTNDPIWSTSSYFRAGNENVINTVTGSDQTPTYTYTFSSALSGVPNLGYGIKKYEGYDYLGQQNFEISRLSLTASTFKVQVQIKGITNVLKLNVPYIAIDPLFPHHLNSFDNVPVTYPSLSLVNVTSKNPSAMKYFTNVVNYTEQASGRTYNSFSEPLSSNKILLFMTNFEIFVVKDLSAPHVQLKVNIQTEILSSQTYSMKIQVGLRAALMDFGFSQIIFNEDDVRSTFQYILVYDEKFIDLTTENFIPIPEQFVDNFIMGFTDIDSTRSYAILDFQWQFATQNGEFGAYVPISVGETYKTQGNQIVDGIYFTLFYIKTWTCPPATPFFDSSTDLCIECPVGNCSTCWSSTVCYECLDNFYLTDAGLCQECDLENCNKCIGEFQCQQCDPGYDLHPDTLLCGSCDIPNCLSCLNETQCEECEDNYFLVNVTETLCVECRSFVSDCSVCHNQSVCAECDEGFHLTADQLCEQCTLSDCVTCENLTHCSQCATNYFLNGDQLCQQCRQFVPNCQRCETQSRCWQCDDGYFIDEDTYQCVGCSDDYCAGAMAESQAQLCDCSSEFNLVSLQRISCSELKVLIVYTALEMTVEQMHERIFVEHLQLLHYEIEHRGGDQWGLILQFQNDIGVDLIIIQFSPNDPQAFDYYAYEVEPGIRYDKQQCQTASDLQKLALGLEVMGLGIMLISLLNCKIVGLELSGLMQLLYFTLADYDFLHLYMAPFLALKQTNGLNLPFFSGQDQVQLPFIIEQMKVSAAFLNNCNLMLLLMFSVGLVGLVCYLIGSLVASQKGKMVGALLLKQGFLTLLIFSSFNIGFSIGMHQKYASEIPGALATWSQVVLYLTLFSIIVTLIALQALPTSNYGEFKDKFKYDFVCRLYIAFSVCFRVMVGFFIAYNNDTPQATLLTLFISLSFLMYFITNLPYHSVLQNYRAGLVHLTTAVILLGANYYRNMKSNTEMMTKARLHNMAMLMISLMVVCVVISLVTLIWEIKKCMKNCCRQQKGDRAPNEESQIMGFYQD